jgi:hypothetical protein
VPSIARQRKPLGCGAFVLIGVLVIAGVCVAGHFSPAGPLPIVLALLLVAGAVTLWRLPLRRPVRTVGMVILAGLLLGAILLFAASVRLAGVILICAATGAAFPYAVAVVRDRTNSLWGGSPAERWLALAVGVSLGLLCLGFAASTARGNDGYYRRYGVAVTADAGGDCEIDTIRINAMEASTLEFCPHATWSVGETTVTGELTSDHGGGAFNLGQRGVPAYALGDHAIAANGLRDYGPMVVLGKISSPWLYVPFPLALVVWIGLVVRARRARPTAVSRS